MIAIVAAGPDHLDGWAALRQALWDETPASEHRTEVEEQLAESGWFLNLVALRGDEVVGFAEAKM